MENRNPEEREARPLHPFGVNEPNFDNRACSAFNVVRGNRQRLYDIAVANSYFESRHFGPSGSISDGRTRSCVTTRENNDANEAVHGDEIYSREYIDNRTEESKTEPSRAANEPINRNLGRARLRTDAIGPGVFLDASAFSSNATTRNPTLNRQNYCGTSNIETSSRRLRHRGSRANMAPNETALREASADAPCNHRSTSTCHTCGNSGRRSAADGQHSTGRNITFLRQRNRLSNDLELLSRPSWCDAKFAYDQVRQGKASGNKSALWFRSKVHNLLFRLGCFIQRKSGFVLIPCLIILAACAVGLKTSTLETSIEKLWVESGGVLEKELEYSREKVGNMSGTTWQLLIQTGSDTATIESLQLHLKAAIAATQVTVTVYDQTWELSDLCYKEVPDLGEITPVFEAIVERLFPCFIMGPLDCFFEGAEVLGPSTPFPAFQIQDISFPALTWKNLDPMALFDALSFLDEVREFKALVQTAGVTHGYQDRWCLDPYSEDCPDKAPNKENKQIPDVKAIINKGCEGYATKLMKWPNDLIVGGIKRNHTGNLTGANGLQTLIQLMGPENMYNFHKETQKTRGIVWDIRKATDVLTMWQRKFVEQMYNIEVNGSKFVGDPDKLYAFAASTTEDLIVEFSNFSYVRVAAGYLLMLAYACITMLRCRASRSQGAIGVVGVLLVALSVMAGLGICSVIGIKFNASTTQVLPFLMLGLGVDDMFLIAHQFGEIACLSYIPFEERTGECMKRVGVSVLLSSIAILSGFLFSMIIPMPALQSFALQGAIITIFNLFCVLFVFPAALSIDLLRRKNNRMDIFCCFKSSSANDVMSLNDTSSVPVEPAPTAHVPPPVRFTTLPSATATTHEARENGATITMHHTIQAFSNESYVTVLGPAAETTFASANPGATDQHLPPQYYPPESPPPRYTPDPAKPSIPSGPRQAFQEQTTSNNEITTSTVENSSIPTTTTSRIIHTRAEERCQAPPVAASKSTSSNLVTPMVSVRSSTHSLVPTNRNRAPWWCFWRKNNTNNSGRAAAKRPEHEYSSCLPFMSVPEFARKYYGPFLMKTPVRVFVLFIFALLLGGSIYGCLQVEDGIDLIDVLPRDSREHEALTAQQKYFSFYNMHIVTQGFDYASKQREIYLLHQNLSDMKYIVRNSDGTKTKFWLEYMRDWLMGLQNAFDDDWSKGFINSSTWTPKASHDGVLAFKLMLQTGKAEEPTQMGRIGCKPPNSQPCPRVNIVRLVSDDGIIREDAFYNYLTAWSQNDTLAYIASLAQIVPVPEKWKFQRNGNLEIPRSRAITYAQMPYYLNGLRENADFVDVIRKVRGLCNHYSREFGLHSYPSGYPFLFWQQYIDLRQWLFIAMGTAILAISLVIALVLMNPWAASLTGLFLIIIATELLGFLGVAGVKLSAVPGVILVASIGLGVEFTVHVTLAFITSCGSRTDRAKSALTHMMGPVVDGAVSTFLGVVMLSGSEFDFIIKYFFHVLSMLVLIGVWNGIVVLPVLLSFIGPPPEVVPVGGGNRLKTPTPPPTPPAEEEEHVCRNCNNNNMRRCRRHDHDCCMARNFTSRDDVTYMQQRCQHDPRGFFPSNRMGYPMRGVPCHPYDIGANPYYHYQINPGYSHPHSVSVSGTSTPQAALEDGQVTICPSADFVVYRPSNVRPPTNDNTQHCDASARLPTNGNSFRNMTRPAGPPLNQSHEEILRDSRADIFPHRADLGQHIATVTSSVTLKVHPRHKMFPVGPPNSSGYGKYSVTESSTFNNKPSRIPKLANPSEKTTPQSFEIGTISGAIPREFPASTSRRENFQETANGETFRREIPESIQNSTSIDAASEAVDTVLQRLDTGSVTG